jgi:hypothetical protein
MSTTFPKRIFYAVIVIFPFDLFVLPLTEQKILITYPLLFVLSIFTIIDRNSAHDRRPAPAIRIPLTLLLIFILLSTLNSNNIPWLITKTIHFYLMFIFFFSVIRYVEDQKYVLFIVKWLLFACAILTIIGLIQFILIVIFKNRDILELTYQYYSLGTNLTDELTYENIINSALLKGIIFRATSLFNTPGEFAFFSYMGLLFFIYFRRILKYNLFIEFIIASLFVVGMLIPFTRIIWVISAVSIVIYLIQEKRIKLFLKSIVITVSFITCLFIFLSYIGYDEPVSQLILSLGSPDEDASTMAREQTFMMGFGKALENPLGDGWATHNNDMHSFYEKHLAEIGIMGTLMLMWFILIPLIESFKTISENKSDILERLNKLCQNFFICLPIMLLSQGTFFRSKQAIMIWLMFGLSYISRHGFYQPTNE